MRTLNNNFRLATLLLLFLCSSCDDNTFEPPPPELRDAFCCPSWVGSDSLVVYRDEGLTDGRRRGFWVSRTDNSNSWIFLAGNVYTPSYSTVANSLAFESNTQIFVAAVVGTKVDTLSIRQITTSGGNFFPSWRPDGTWIVHDRRTCDVGGDTDTTCAVFVTRPDGSESQLVTKGVYPVWAPDGASLAFARMGEVYSIDYPSRANLRVLTDLHGYFNPPSAIGALSYSPDGTTILVEVRTSPQPTIYAIPSGGGGKPTRVAVGLWPSWSPTGEQMAFIAKGDTDPEKNGTVWLFDFGARKGEQLTHR